MRFGVNATTEIQRFYLRQELDEDFCQDSLDLIVFPHDLFVFV